MSDIPDIIIAFSKNTCWLDLDNLIQTSSVSSRTSYPIGMPWSLALPGFAWFAILLTSSGAVLKPPLDWRVCRSWSTAVQTDDAAANHNVAAWDYDIQ
jgi:hypothetical protein